MAEQVLDYAGLLANMQATREALTRVIQGLDIAIEGLTQVVGGDAPLPAGPPLVVAGGIPRPSGKIQSDTFFRMSIGEATKKFLEIVGQPPRGLPEITQSLNSGGLKCKAGSVATIVGREAAVRGFVKVGSEWGLEAWYPGRRENGGNP